MEKSKIFFPVINALGHTVSRDEYKTSNKILDSIAFHALPKDQKELKSFLGLCGFALSTCPKYVQTIAPLQALLKIGQKYECKPKQQQVFLDIRGKLIQASKLYPFKKGGELMVTTDANFGRISGVLLTRETKDSEWKVVL